MKSVLIAAILLVSVGTARAATRSRSGHFSGQPRYDPSLDFSKQFDEEVQWEREHRPVEQEDPEPVEAPRHPRHRRARR